MPFTAIPTKADGEVLTASYLNTLSANQEFLYSLGNSANAPFNSHRSEQVLLESTEAQWFIRHRTDFLHVRVQSYGGSYIYCRIYYDGIKVMGDESGNTVFADSVDLTDLESYPNWHGAWSGSAVDYEDDVNGDGGGSGNGDDGHIVSNGGSYYRCILAHTSGTDDDEPGVGANTATYWEIITAPVVGNMYDVYAEVLFGSGTEVGVEYIFETSEASL